jgi:hypothetical protein
MKSGYILYWLFFFGVLGIAYLNKVTSSKMARKVIQTKRYPLPGVWLIPIGHMAQPAYGKEAVRIARSYVIIADILIWAVIWGFTVFGLFVWEL